MVPVPMMPVSGMVMVMQIPMVPMMETGSPMQTMKLGASLRDRATLPSPLRGLGPSGGYPSRLRSLRSLRAPLARRLAALTAVAGPAPWRHGSTASPAGPPQSPRAGAARRARRGLRLARPRRLRRPRGSPRLRPGHHPVPRRCRLRLAPAPALRRARIAVPLSPLVRALLRSASRTSLRTAPRSHARTGAGTAASAFGSVLRTAACGSGRTARRSRAAAAPLCGLRPRRFPPRSCCTLGRPGPPGAALVLTPDAPRVPARHRCDRVRRGCLRG